MSSEGTTNIADLPCEGDNPVQLHTSEVNAAAPSGRDDVNALVTGIQAASAAGALRLPERDVPQAQDHLSRDGTTRANYVPDARGDYIAEAPPALKGEQRVERPGSAEVSDIVDALQTPLLLAILYFGFHMPVLRKAAYERLPFLFGKDGNPTTLGAAVTSVAFAASYIGLRKGLEFLSA
jgi:hypothetical protein